MKCPACRQAMTPKRYEATSIHECQACRSVWISTDALSSAIGSTEKFFSADEIKNILSTLRQTPQAARNLKCPTCSDVMVCHHYAADLEIQIDRCPKDHGVFLDNSELEAIQLKFEDRSAQSSAKKTSIQSTSQAQKRCPRDGEQLKPETYEQQSVDLCPKCGGFWCDDGELGQIVKSRDIKHGDVLFPEFKGNEADANAKGADIYSHVTPCVVCGAAMVHLNYCANSGIMIDSCRQGHGTWLDRSELERVQVFAERWQKNAQDAYARHAQKFAAIAQQSSAYYEAMVRRHKAEARSLSVVGRILNSIFGQSR